MFHDTIPEEREEQQKKLIALLRRGLHESVFLSSPEQSQIIDRVRERLALEENHPSHLEVMPVQQAGQIGVRSLTREPSRQRHLPRFVNSLVAVLIVGILIGAALLLFRPSLHQNAAPPPIDSTVLTASTQVKGLQATIHLVTPGTYFLSELVAVDVSLTNHTHVPFRLDGSSRPENACFSSALSVQITGGNAPFYTPPGLDIVCTQPLFLTTLAPGQTLTIRCYLPVTGSGEVTIMMGGMRGVPHTSPLDGHWPSLRIHVDSRVPANRVISLHEQGAQVIIQAPSAAHTHLLYRASTGCGLSLTGGPDDWSPLSTTTLSQPTCPAAHGEWQYIVSAPGYSIAAGKRVF